MKDGLELGLADRSAQYKALQRRRESVKQLVEEIGEEAYVKLLTPSKSYW
jgi:hypothetical protein